MNFALIFVLCFWLARNYMKICFRNINSAKLKWKIFCMLVDSSWISFSTSLDSFFQMLFFFFHFFANYCHLLSFLKDRKVILSLTFALLNNFFHHKYDDENFSKSNKKQDSLRNQFPRRTSFHAKPVSLWNTNIGC